MQRQRAHKWMPTLQHFNLQYQFAGVSNLNTVMLQYFSCEKPLRFCHFAANSSTLQSYLCDCGGSNSIFGQSRLKWVCALRFLAFCWLACFSNARFTLSFASLVATTPIAVSSRLGLIVKSSKILPNTHLEIAAAVEV